MPAVERVPRKREVRQPDFIVRARVGNGRQAWATVGSAWKRDNDEGFSIKLNAIPIGQWDGVLKVLPPFAQDDGEDGAA
jgi:hypothetical protein